MTDREIIDLLLDYYDGLGRGEAKDDKDTLIAIEVAIIDRTSLGLYATVEEYRSMLSILSSELSLCGVDFGAGDLILNDPVESNRRLRITQRCEIRVADNTFRIEV